MPEKLTMPEHGSFKDLLISRKTARLHQPDADNFLKTILSKAKIPTTLELLEFSQKIRNSKAENSAHINSKL